MKNIGNNRHSIRIKNYDYSQEGWYYVTICTKDRKQILSKIHDCNCRGRALPQNTEIGNIIENSIKYFNNKYYNLKIEKYVIMPNHLHMIIQIKGKDGALPLQDVIRTLKSFTSVQCYKRRYLKSAKLWQRNYYEHIIRNEKEYWKIYEYIENNHQNWITDKYYEQ